MVAPLDDWRPKGKWQRLSPCGRYQINKVIVSGEFAYYAYPQIWGQKYGGPFQSAEEAHDCCISHNRNNP